MQTRTTLLDIDKCYGTIKSQTLHHVNLVIKGVYRGYEMRLRCCYGSSPVLTRGDKISLSPGAHQNLRVQSHKEEEKLITMRGFVHGPCFCVLAMTLLAMLPPTETK